MSYQFVLYQNPRFALGPPFLPRAPPPLSRRFCALCSSLPIPSLSTSPLPLPFLSCLGLSPGSPLLCVWALGRLAEGSAYSCRSVWDSARFFTSSSACFWACLLLTALLSTSIWTPPATATWFVVHHLHQLYIALVTGQLQGAGLMTATLLLSVQCVLSVGIRRGGSRQRRCNAIGANLPGCCWNAVGCVRKSWCEQCVHNCKQGDDREVDFEER